MRLRLFSLLAVVALLTSCVNNDLNDLGNNTDTNGNGTTKEEWFDFSTVQKVNLTVDYTACNPAGAVFFSVYGENPLDGDALKEDVSPIYEGYTNAQGVYNATVELPAFSTELYVYTGNFFIDQELLTAKVANGAASAVATSSTAAARMTRRAEANVGEQTNSLESLYHLSYLVDRATGNKTDTQIYKEWKTPLGTWGNLSGRPSYIMQPGDEDYDKLAFNAEEMKGIYQAISGALEDKKACPAVYREPGDLTLTEDAEVGVTLIGSNTCWNNTLGYYYYKEGEEPQTTMDLNIIMLLPNTQDGKSKLMKNNGNRYYGNVAMDRGDVIKLMYYPNIASGDMSGATSVFPSGTKIGFILKSNGWAMQKKQGEHVFYNSYNDHGTSEYGRLYNVWQASTDGMSYCLKDDKAIIVKDNPQGKSRTAKFAYENANGQQYAIVSFEDACNDEDYDDLILAMKPVGVFKDLPVVKPRVTTTTGVYAFEDLWPNKGDYDMNDAVIDFKHHRELTLKNMGDSYVVTKETFELTSYMNYVELKSGLALTLEGKDAPTSIVMKKVPFGRDTVTTEFQRDGNVFLLTENLLSDQKTIFILELTYENGAYESNAASVKPFIFRKEAADKRWEVHIPFEAPSPKMNYSYFGTQDDRSNVEAKIFYVREGDYPFAFFLSGVTIDTFTKTLLNNEYERVPIGNLYPDFLEWSTSKGAQKKDWYKHPKS